MKVLYAAWVIAKAILGWCFLIGSAISLFVVECAAIWLVVGSVVEGALGLWLSVSIGTALYLSVVFLIAASNGLLEGVYGRFRGYKRSRKH